MVYLDMNLRETIPTQAEIEEFLARDFFPKYPDPMPLAETVDMVQLQFEVPDDARSCLARERTGRTEQSSNALRGSP